jgi:hypothetical protein
VFAAGVHSCKVVREEWSSDLFIFGATQFSEKRNILLQIPCF